MQARVYMRTGGNLLRQGWHNATSALRPLAPLALRSQRSINLAHTFAQDTTSASLKVASAASLSTGGTMGSDSPAIFSMGQHTLPVDRRILHGSIRGQFLAAFRDALSASGAQADLGVVLIQGGGPFHVYSTDGELIFKQEAYMHYLFGVNEEDCYGAIDIKTGRSLLFMPRLPDVYAVWMGALKTPQDFQAKYAVDAVYYVDELPARLKDLLKTPQDKPGPLYTLNGTNSDSGREVPGATFDGIEEFDVQHGPLHTVLTESRVIKTPEEVAILRYANRIGGLGHVAMMHTARAGLYEYQLEATFLHTVYSQGGCRLVGYTPISASGPNGAVLHYGHAGAPNDRQLGPDDMMLVDMGCEYYRYGSDITCSWPVSGHFSPSQALIYNAVLDAHVAVEAAMKPGVFWPDMQTLAYRTILSGLLKGGLLKGDVDDMLQVDLGALFMPHGLGHFLGIDTHDVGGYLPGNPARITRPGYKSLRTARVLKEGMIITVEPGCYFSHALLLPAFENPSQSPFLVKDALLSFMSFGGVRIEDNVLVTATGAESLTHVPRTVKEIEAVLAGAPWTPQ